MTCATRALETRISTSRVHALELPIRVTLIQPSTTISVEQPHEAVNDVQFQIDEGTGGDLDSPPLEMDAVLFLPKIPVYSEFICACSIDISPPMNYLCLVCASQSFPPTLNIFGWLVVVEIVTDAVFGHHGVRHSCIFVMRPLIPSPATPRTPRRTLGNVTIDLSAW
jgi:hypothetical protein